MSSDRLQIAFCLDAGQERVRRVLASSTAGAFEMPTNLAGSAWDGERMVGLALATSDFQSLTCITDLTVEPPRRSQGIARELMRRVHDAVPAARVLLLATPLMEPYDPARLPRPSAAAEPSWLKTIDAILAAEYASKLTVGTLARRVGMHRVHVSRTFRRLRNESIIHALRRRRVDAACRQLMRDEVVLAGLALHVGFSDQAQFSRAFKRITGTTPGAFRALFRRRRAIAPPPLIEQNAGWRAWD